MLGRGTRTRTQIDGFGVLGMGQNCTHPKLALHQCFKGFMLDELSKNRWYMCAIKVQSHIKDGLHLVGDGPFIAFENMAIFV